MGGKLSSPCPIQLRRDFQLKSVIKALCLQGMLVFFKNRIICLCVFASVSFNRKMRVQGFFFSQIELRLFHIAFLNRTHACQITWNYPTRNLVKLLSAKNGPHLGAPSGKSWSLELNPLLPSLPSSRSPSTPEVRMVASQGILVTAYLLGSHLQPPCGGVTCRHKAECSQCFPLPSA